MALIPRQRPIPHRHVLADAWLNAGLSGQRDRGLVAKAGVDLIKNGEIAMLLNTTEGRQAIADSYTLIMRDQPHVFASAIREFVHETTAASA